MHDTVDLERRGTPAVFVASDAFVEAAQIQGSSLGYQPARVFVDHPIQDRTDEEVKVLAEAALEALLTRITES